MDTWVGFRLNILIELGLILSEPRSLDPPLLSVSSIRSIKLSASGDLVDKGRSARSFDLADNPNLVPALNSGWVLFLNLFQSRSSF
ncbi:hypothetical protein EVAR_18229_1 [Eumeta japonica]|uniref:Uncharacterized protein n=1 Tax=Eumeta variegata TaxID=151549 RepID=A0A4C1UKU8_EUMVA|nr:hypothetical protein EVAR_18229_1 [Eumeta japonica]